MLWKLFFGLAQIALVFAGNVPVAKKNQINYWASHTFRQNRDAANQLSISIMNDPDRYISNSEFHTIWTSPQSTDAVRIMALQKLKDPNEASLKSMILSYLLQLESSKIKYRLGLTFARQLLTNPSVTALVRPTHKWEQFVPFLVKDLSFQPFYEFISRDLPVIHEDQFMTLVLLFPKIASLHQRAFERLDGPLKFQTMNQPLQHRTLSWFLVALQRYKQLERKVDEVKKLDIAKDSARHFEKELVERGVVYFRDGADYLIPGLTPSIGAQVLVQLSQQENQFTADQFTRMISYYSGEHFDADVRKLAMQTLTHPTLECIHLLTEEDAPGARSLLSSRFLLHNWKADTPVDKMALQWASPEGIQHVLNSELHSVSDNQFVFLLEHFWNNQDIVETLSAKLNDPAKSGLLEMLVKSMSRAYTETIGEAAHASKIGSLVNSMSHAHL